jgi:hypothetical protein
VDHLIGPDPRAQAATWRKSEWAGIERGDFAWSAYEHEGGRRECAVGVSMFRRGRFADGSGERAVAIRKGVWLEADGAVRVEYELAGDDATELVFAPEWSLSFLTGDPEWVFMSAGGAECLDVRKMHVLEDVERAHITDRIRGQRLVLECEPSAWLWARPLETASQSEGGLERLFQGLGLVTAWPLSLRDGERACFTVTIRSTPEG